MPDRPTDSTSSWDDLPACARRLWKFAEEINQAARLPGVDLRIVKASPSVWDVLGHIVDAGRTERELELGEKHARIEGRLAAVRADLQRARGHQEDIAQGARAREIVFARAEARLERLAKDIAELRPVPASSVPARSRLSWDEGREVDAPTDAGAVCEHPWIRDLSDAIVAEATINGLKFTLLDYPIEDPPSSWPECIRRPVTSATRAGLTGFARDVVLGKLHPTEGCEAYLARFTRRIVRLDRSVSGAVSQVLWEGRCQGAANPIAYVRSAAERLEQRIDGWLDPSRSRDAFALGSLESLEMTTATGDPLGALISDRRDPFDACLTQVDLDLAIRRAGLSADEVTLLRARIENISRQAAADYLGWPSRRVEAGWKALQRKRPRLRGELSA